MSTLAPAYLTQLGPIERRNGPSSAIYLALGEGGEELARRTESPPDDAAGIRGLAASLPSHAPCCALDLAELGAQLGFEVRDLPPLVAEERATAAYLASAPDHLRLRPGTVRELCMAAADYERARPWTKLAIHRRFRAKETIRGSGGVLCQRELLVQVHADGDPDGPRLQVEDASAARRAQVTVTLASDPAWVADAVEDAYGERFTPRIAYVEDERLLAPDDSHALLLAAAMRAAVDRMRGGAGHGRASSESLAFEVDVEFATSIPEAPLPQGDTPSELRAVGRLMAASLAGQVPLPYYDDYVCVVLDQYDPQTETAMLHLDTTVAMLRGPLPEGFAGVYRTGITVEHFFARWMRAEHMAEMIEHNALPEESVAALRADLPPFALRVMSFGSHLCEAFFVDFAPLTVQAHRDRLRDEARHKETGGAEEEDAMDGPSSKEPTEVTGTWRDALVYLPASLPSDWSVGERNANGTSPIAAGPLSVVLAATRLGGRRWVKIYFPEHPLGRPVTREEARDVYEKLVGCGRFGEMNIVAGDAELVPLAGARVFAAAIAKARPRSATVERTESEVASLIERAKVRLSEVVARVRDEKRLMSDYCVILDAKGGLPGEDGVVMTRELIERIFTTPESDPFHIRARFEEPRPADECVVFVKHKDGIEEMHVSLEKVELRPEREA